MPIITTVSGTGVSGSQNTTATKSATFCNPSKVAIDSLGNLYVTDRLNYLIRKIEPNNNYKVTTTTSTLYPSPITVNMTPYSDIPQYSNGTMSIIGNGYGGPLSTLFLTDYTSAARSYSISGTMNISANDYGSNVSWDNSGRVLYLQMYLVAPGGADTGYAYDPSFSALFTFAWDTGSSQHTTDEIPLPFIRNIPFSLYTTINSADIQNNMRILPDGDSTDPAILVMQLSTGDLNDTGSSISVGFPNGITVHETKPLP